MCVHHADKAVCGCEASVLDTMTVAQADVLHLTYVLLESFTVGLMVANIFLLRKILITVVRKASESLSRRLTTPPRSPHAALGEVEQHTLNWKLYYSRRQLLEKQGVL